MFADANTIGRHLFLVADIVPASTLELLGNEIARIAAKSDGRLTFGFLLGLGIALWSANAGMKAIFDALNIIYDEEREARHHPPQPDLAALHDLRPSAARCSRSASSWCFR